MDSDQWRRPRRRIETRVPGGFLPLRRSRRGEGPEPKGSTGGAGGFQGNCDRFLGHSDGWPFALTHSGRRYKLFAAIALRKFAARFFHSFGRSPPGLRSKLGDLRRRCTPRGCQRSSERPILDAAPRSLRRPHGRWRCRSAPTRTRFEHTMEVLERIWEILAGIINGILGRFERGITALFGSANARFLRRLQPKVDAINALEDKYQQLSNDELRGEDRRVPPPARRRRDARRHPGRGLRRRAARRAGGSSACGTTTCSSSAA